MLDNKNFANKAFISEIAWVFAWPESDIIFRAKVSI